MKKFFALTAIALTMTSAQAATIYLKAERPDGMLKQCVYDYFGRDYIVTIQSYQLCKLSITV